jgi:tetratricopeptide (TPR) repeat protein
MADNVLYSIIGLLLGCIVGFVCANSVNQRGFEKRSTASPAPLASTDSKLPPNHPPLPSNAVADQGGDPQAMQADVQAKIKLARDEPNNFAAQKEAAEMFYQINRYDEAIDFLTRANQLKPDDYEVVVNLGNANFESERFELAEKWYTAALAKKPDDINVRTDLGLTFLFRKPSDIDRAIKEFRRSLEKDPNHEQSLQNLTVALTQKGDAKEAQATLDKLERSYPNNRALTKLHDDLDKLKSSSNAQASASGKVR